MSDACPNCGKPVLESDTLCWHCGYQLPKRPAARTAAGKRAGSGATGRSLASAAESDAVEYDLRALAVYGLLTFAVILGLWLVMRSLSSRPILVRSAAFDLGDWVSVTDVELRYTLSLPSDWQWLDVAFRDQNELLADIIARQPYVARALHPLGAAAGDVDIVAVAVGTQVLETTEPQPFVVIGRSAELGALTPQQALDRLTDAPGISERDIDTRVAGQPQARYTILDLPNAYQCRHLFVTGQDTGYLVAACAPQNRFGTLQHDLDDILDSFQLLEH